MLKKLLFLALIAFTAIGYSQSDELEYKEYSYTELFQLIEDEKDSVYELKDAIIRFDKETDSIYAGKGSLMFGSKADYFRKDTIIIDKVLNMNNVQFLPYHFETTSTNELIIYQTGFSNMIFKKPVHFVNSLASRFENCIFENEAKFEIHPNSTTILDYFDQNINIKDLEVIENFEATLSDITFKGVQFNHGLTINYSFNKDYNSTHVNNIMFTMDNCEINSSNISSDSNYIVFYDMGITSISNSTFKGSYLQIDSSRNELFTLENSTFNEITRLAFSNSEEQSRLKIDGNIFLNDVLLGDDLPNENTQIGWSQWAGKVINLNTYHNYFSHFFQSNISKYPNPDNLVQLVYKKHDSLYQDFKENYHLKTADRIKQEIDVRTKYLDFYKAQYDTDNYNLVYQEFKDLQTVKSKILYLDNPSFDSYFTWKINQFLKVFSAYGTKPARAVVFSIYVILFFAFIYLLFPNSWDSLGKKRLMHRFEFFQKYLRRKDGMHTIYLEEQQNEISTYQEFKKNLENTKTELPSFFITWSKPLYNASMFSSRITAKFLKTTDVLKGKWQDLTPKQKRWKNIQIGFLLTIGLMYDLFIKVLNALMLSINTFTTLGFGEIPIKGLPRYLAIIQGFIGWFMLTIFSVSLISQLLN